MNLWLRVRRAHTALIVVMCVALALLFIGNLALPLPNLLGGARLEVPLALLLPLFIAIMLASGLANGDPLQEAVCSRPLRWLDIAYCLSIALLALAACGLVYVVSGISLALAAGRNVFGYVGLMLLGRALLGAQAAAVAPLAVAIVTNLFGRQPDLHVRSWAWAIAPSESATAVVGVVLSVIVGVIATLIDTPRATRAE